MLFGLMARRLAAGERQIGWKVGLTSKAIQQQFNVHEPVFGCILESEPSGHVFAPGDLISPGFENELCLRLRQDLAGAITPDDARAAIDVVYPSLEIIETRGNLTEQLALALADNAQQKTVILGSPVTLPVHPELRRGPCHHQWSDRRHRHRGSGARQSAQFRGLAGGETGANSDARLKAGEIIMSGSFTRQFPIKPGDTIRCEFSGVGAVETSMTAT